MTTFADLNNYDAIFIRALRCHKEYEIVMNSDWGVMMGLCLSNNFFGVSADVDSWIANLDNREHYSHGITLIKENNKINMYGDDDFFNQEFSESVSLSFQEFKDLIHRWRALYKEFPPVILLHRENGKIILTPRPDIDPSKL